MTLHLNLHRRWMLALSAFTLGVATLFGLFAMAFVYSVEDRFLERLLRQEAVRQQAQLEAHGRYGPPGSDFITLHLQSGSLPADLAAQLAQAPRRREFAGQAGRHYHVQTLDPAGGPPWLVAEVSGQLIVRPMRADLLLWLAGWGLGAVVLAMALGWLLARRVTAPLEALARRVALADPQRLPPPAPLPASRRTADDEVGAVTRAFDALLERTRAFIDREQAFTRDASHELRTPLAVMRLSIERLLGDSAIPREAAAALRTMHAATLLMEQTVQTLLLMAREPTQAAAGTAPPVALLPLAEQWVLAHAGWLDQQALRLALALGRHDALALPAPVLQLALASLLGNAFAHGTPGGTVQVGFEEGALVVRNPGPLADEGGSAEPPRPAAGGGLGLTILHRLLASHGASLMLVHADGRTTATLRAQPS